MPTRPLIFDFDDSILPVADGEIRIALQEWQESIRFGCSWREFERLEAHLAGCMPASNGPVFMGSGDYHHITLLLLRRLGRVAAERAERGEGPKLPPSFDLMVCDNHPDNMRYPFGIHCGSWVSHAATLPFVRHVHVIGISSADITLAHAVENRLTPFRRQKLTYWSVGRPAAWLERLGFAAGHRDFASPDALLREFLPVAQASDAIYLSVDKDVFAPDVVRTNWDQGTFGEAHLTYLIHACAGKLAGVDICGEVSEYRYAGWFKRLLSRLDGQEAIDPGLAKEWQVGQQRLNIRLMREVSQAACENEISIMSLPKL